MRLAVTATPSVARFAPLLLHGDPATAFYLARELGYDGVELHLRRPEDVNPAEIARLSTSCQLAIPTLGTGMAAGEDGLTFADPDPAIRRAAVDRVRDHIRLAAELGSAVTIGLIRGRLGPDPEERRRRQGCFLQCLEECCQAGEDLGVTLLLEPLNRFIIIISENAVAMYEASRDGWLCDHTAIILDYDQELCALLNKDESLTPKPCDPIVLDPSIDLSGLAS